MVDPCPPLFLKEPKPIKLSFTTQISQRFFNLIRNLRLQDSIVRTSPHDATTFLSTTAFDFSEEGYISHTFHVSCRTAATVIGRESVLGIVKPVSGNYWQLSMGVVLLQVIRQLQCLSTTNFFVPIQLLPEVIIGFSKVRYFIISIRSPAAKL